MNSKQTVKLCLLAAMMFLLYAVWGVWSASLGATLDSRYHMSGTDIGAVFGVLWLACIIAPFIGSQIVDRIMPSQIYLGISAAVCSFAAYKMSHFTTVADLKIWMWVWSLAFAPNIGITNSIVFYHLGQMDLDERKREQYFSIIRTAGTIGWIVVAFVLPVMITANKDIALQFRPIESMQIAAVLGIVLTILAFLLPNTPPAKEGTSPFAFLKAFSLFKTVPGFLIFMIISLIISTEFQFYYVLSGPFMTNSLHISEAAVAPFKSIAQMAEIVCLAVLTPLSLKHLGVRKTLVIGALAWPARYLIFAYVESTPIVMASMSFHGIGFAFVMVTSYIYIDRICPKDIRASAQNLYTLATLGVGNWAGSMFSGWLKDYFTTTIADHPEQNITDWKSIFLVPAVLTIACAAAFWFTFKEPKDAVEGDEAMPELAPAA